jgi:hypothetical protein
VGWRFNPAPGWPSLPPGFEPWPEWRPDPSWSSAPPGWQFWVWVGEASPEYQMAPFWQEQAAPEAPAGATQTLDPSRRATTNLAEPASSVPPPERHGARSSTAATAIISVCLAYFTNATTTLMSRNSLVWVAFITVGGVMVGLLLRFVFTRERWRGAKVRGGREAGDGVRNQSDPSSAPDAHDSKPTRRPPSAAVLRRVIRVVVSLAAVLLLAAFILLQLSLSVTVVSVSVLALIVGVSFFPSTWASEGLRHLLVTVGNSTVCITLTLASSAVANGLLTPGALGGTWQSTSWATVHDDPHAINFSQPMAWGLAVKNGCHGQRCSYDAQARDAGGQVVIGPVVLRPQADGTYSGRWEGPGNCVDLQDSTIVKVPRGYVNTFLYRLEPGPYVGLPGRQRPKMFTIQLTWTGKSTPEAKAQNCPDLFEVTRGTAQRN